MRLASIYDCASYRDINSSYIACHQFEEAWQAAYKSTNFKVITRGHILTQRGQMPLLEVAFGGHAIYHSPLSFKSMCHLAAAAYHPNPS